MIFQAVSAGLLAYSLHQFPQQTILCISVLCILYAVYAKIVYDKWSRSFAGKRVKRSDDKSPSNHLLPDIKSLEDNKKRILDNSKYHPQFDTCELLNDVPDMEVTRKANNIFRERAKRTSFAIESDKLGKITGAKLGTTSMVEKAEELNMDHIYVGFFDYLWALTFIGPFSAFLWRSRTIKLRIRAFLVKRGILKTTPCDYERECGRLLLEQTQAIHYYARTKPENGNIAGFFFANFPYVNNDCEYGVADLFAVDVDLDTKKFVKAKLDDINLTAKETYILLWFNTIAAQHVKLHSMANWGVNLDVDLVDINPFFRRNSVVTVMYNYFGFTSFNSYLKTWANENLVSEGWTSSKKPLVQCFSHGIRDNVWQHGQIEELVKYSEFVHFVVKVRAIFHAEFAKHKRLFPGVNGEAMFVGTVLHSLDHTLMDWNMKDPLWLDVDDPRFGKMAEVGRVVKVGFVSDVPGLLFHKRFKDSGHPFYDAVYEKAAKVNKLFADNMDTCIIK